VKCRVVLTAIAVFILDSHWKSMSVCTQVLSHTTVRCVVVVSDRRYTYPPTAAHTQTNVLSRARCARWHTKTASTCGSTAQRNTESVFRLDDSDSVGLMASTWLLLLWLQLTLDNMKRIYGHFVQQLSGISQCSSIRSLRILFFEGYVHTLTYSFLA